MKSDTELLKLSNKTFSQISAHGLAGTNADYLKLPVKVLQFGTGVLLRGLTDHVINEANRNGIFNGRIAVVKSTGTGSADAFAEQDNLYTLLIKGIKNKQLVEQAYINTVIHKVLSAADEWDKVLLEAENPELKIVISNTTEVGIQLVKEDINQQPPRSFPAKLLAVLHHRYKLFKGEKESGLVIIPTELLPDNGIILKSIVTELAEFNKLDDDFINWLNESNHFCNSLVDKIVTGKPSKEEQDQYEQKSGYSDELLIVAEPYCLWAIEGDEKVRSILSFEQAGAGAIVVPDIQLHRELKLRLLNGTHTLSCALAIAKGFDVVNAATSDGEFAKFLTDLMGEIRAGMPFKPDEDVAARFSESVLDRFANPYIQHLWVAIAQQYTSKIITRVLPVFNEYYNAYKQPPLNMAKGFAAYVFFVSKLTEENGDLYLEYKNVKHLIKDDKAILLMQKIKHVPATDLAEVVLGSDEVWGQDLNQLPEFTRTVQNYLNEIINEDLVKAV